MPNLLVRNLPEPIHAELQKRAEASGQSLQQYLSDELTRLATTPTMREILDRIGRRKGGRVGLNTAVTDLASERSQR